MSLGVVCIQVIGNVQRLVFIGVDDGDQFRHLKTKLNSQFGGALSPHRRFVYRGEVLDDDGLVANYALFDSANIGATLSSVIIRREYFGTDDDILKEDHMSNNSGSDIIASHGLSIGNGHSHGNVSSGNNSSANVMTSSGIMAVTPSTDEVYLPRLQPSRVIHGTQIPMPTGAPSAATASSSSSSRPFVLPDPFHLYVQFVQWGRKSCVPLALDGVHRSDRIADIKARVAILTEVARHQQFYFHHGHALDDQQLMGEIGLGKNSVIMCVTSESNRWQGAAAQQTTTGAHPRHASSRRANSRPLSPLHRQARISSNGQSNGPVPAELLARHSILPTLPSTPGCAAPPLIITASSSSSSSSSSPPPSTVPSLIPVKRHDRRPGSPLEPESPLPESGEFRVSVKVVAGPIVSEIYKIRVAQSSLVEDLRLAVSRQINSRSLPATLVFNTRPLHHHEKLVDAGLMRRSLVYAFMNDDTGNSTSPPSSPSPLATSPSAVDHTQHGHSNGSGHVMNHESSAVLPGAVPGSSNSPTSHSQMRTPPPAGVTALHISSADTSPQHATSGKNSMMNDHMHHNHTQHHHAHGHSSVVMPPLTAPNGQLMSSVSQPAHQQHAYHNHGGGTSSNNNGQMSSAAGTAAVIGARLHRAPLTPPTGHRTTAATLSSMTSLNSVPLGSGLLPPHGGQRLAKGSSLLAPLGNGTPGSPSQLPMVAPTNDMSKPPPLWIPSSMSTPPASPKIDAPLLSVQPPSPSLLPLAATTNVPPLSPFSAAMRDLSLDHRHGSVPTPTHSNGGHATMPATATVAGMLAVNNAASMSTAAMIAANHDPSSMSSTSSALFSASSSSSSSSAGTGMHQILERRHRKVPSSGTLPGLASSIHFYSPSTTTPPESPVQYGTSLSLDKPPIPRFGKGRLVVGPSSKTTHSSSRASSSTTTWSPLSNTTTISGIIHGNNTNVNNINGMNGSAPNHVHTIVAYHSSGSPPMDMETLAMRDVRTTATTTATATAMYRQQSSTMIGEDHQIIMEGHPSSSSIHINPNEMMRPLSHGHPQMSGMINNNGATLSIATSPNTTPTPGSRARLLPPPAGGRGPIDIRDDTNAAPPGLPRFASKFLEQVTEEKDTDQDMMHSSRDSHRMMSVVSPTPLMALSPEPSPVPPPPSYASSPTSATTSAAASAATLSSLSSSGVPLKVDLDQERERKEEDRRRAVMARRQSQRNSNSRTGWPDMPPVVSTVPLPNNITPPATSAGIVGGMIVNNSSLNGSGSGGHMTSSPSMTAVGDNDDGSLFRSRHNSGLLRTSSTAATSNIVTAAVAAIANGALSATTPTSKTGALSATSSQEPSPTAAGARRPSVFILNASRVSGSGNIAVVAGAGVMVATNGTNGMAMTATHTTGGTAANPRRLSNRMSGSRSFSLSAVPVGATATTTSTSHVIAAAQAVQAAAAAAAQTMSSITAAHTHASLSSSPVVVSNIGIGSTMNTNVAQRRLMMKGAAAAAAAMLPIQPNIISLQSQPSMTSTSTSQAAAIMASITNASPSVSMSAGTMISSSHPSSSSGSYINGVFNSNSSGSFSAPSIAQGTHRVKPSMNGTHMITGTGGGAGSAASFFSALSASTGVSSHPFALRRVHSLTGVNNSSPTAASTSTLNTPPPTAGTPTAAAAAAAAAGATIAVPVREGLRASHARRRTRPVDITNTSNSTNSSSIPLPPVMDGSEPSSPTYDPYDTLPDQLQPIISPDGTIQPNGVMTFVNVNDPHALIAVTSSSSSSSQPSVSYVAPATTSGASLSSSVMASSSSSTTPSAPAIVVPDNGGAGMSVAVSPSLGSQASPMLFPSPHHTDALDALPFADPLFLSTNSETLQPSSASSTTYAASNSNLTPPNGASSLTAANVAGGQYPIDYAALHADCLSPAGIISDIGTISTAHSIGTVPSSAASQHHDDEPSSHDDVASVMASPYQFGQPGVPLPVSLPLLAAVAAVPAITLPDASTVPCDYGQLPAGIVAPTGPTYAATLGFTSANIGSSIAGATTTSIPNSTTTTGNGVGSGALGAPVMAVAGDASVDPRRTSLAGSLHQAVVRRQARLAQVGANNKRHTSVVFAAHHIPHHAHGSHQGPAYQSASAARPPLPRQYTDATRMGAMHSILSSTRGGNGDAAEQHQNQPTTELTIRPSTSDSSTSAPPTGILTMNGSGANGRSFEFPVPATPPSGKSSRASGHYLVPSDYMHTPPMTAIPGQPGSMPMMALTNGQVNGNGQGNTNGNTGNDGSVRVLSSVTPPETPSGESSGFTTPVDMDRRRTPKSDGFDLFVSVFAARKSKVTLQLRRLAPSETVGSIKQRVAKETGISVDAQRLMWNQETLDDERTLGEYCISPLGHLFCHLLRPL